MGRVVRRTDLVRTVRAASEVDPVKPDGGIDPGRPRPFVARYPGRCHADCGEPIEPGDDVIRVEGALTHEVCVLDVAPESVRVETVCGRCYLTSCDCD